MLCNHLQVYYYVACLLQNVTMQADQVVEEVLEEEINDDVITLFKKSRGRLNDSGFHSPIIVCQVEFM